MNSRALVATAVLSLVFPPVLGGTEPPESAVPQWTREAHWYHVSVPQFAAGEPGKEILYPVATVVIGGLITCTLLEFFVRPALFWTFGIGSARRVVQRGQEEIAFDPSDKASQDV